MQLAVLLLDIGHLRNTFAAYSKLGRPRTPFGRGQAGYVLIF